MQPTPNGWAHSSVFRARLRETLHLLQAHPGILQRVRFRPPAGIPSPLAADNPCIRTCQIRECCKVFLQLLKLRVFAQATENLLPDGADNLHAVFQDQTSELANNIRLDRIRTTERFRPHACCPREPLCPGSLCFVVVSRINGKTRTVRGYSLVKMVDAVGQCMGHRRLFRGYLGAQYYGSTEYIHLRFRI